MTKQKLFESIFILVVFMISLYGRKLLHAYVPMELSGSVLRVAYIYAWWVIPVMVFVGISYGFRNLGSELGLQGGFAAALLFALFTVSPMFIGSALTGIIQPELDAWILLNGTLFAGFFEEVLFRGFLFGLLFRKARWGFIPASLAGAVVFGLGHVYQGSTASEVAGVFIVTAMGAVWFAWLYIEWDDNLWVPVLLHVFMNLSWALFDVSDNALGGILPNVFRITTIFLTVWITLRMKLRLAVNRKNLWVN
jgi:hypothetical protein